MLDHNTVKQLVVNEPQVCFGLEFLEACKRLPSPTQANWLDITLKGKPDLKKEMPYPNCVKVVLYVEDNHLELSLIIYKGDISGDCKDSVSEYIWNMDKLKIPAEFTPYLEMKLNTAIRLLLEQEDQEEYRKRFENKRNAVLNGVISII